jgi:hypothetical protein
MTAAVPLVGMRAWTSCHISSGGGVPVPIHCWVFVVDQETVNVCPATTLAGVMDIVAVGGGGESTVTVTGADVTCPMMVSHGSHVTVKVYVPGDNGRAVMMLGVRGSALTMLATGSELA